MKPGPVLPGGVLWATAFRHGTDTNLVANGSFEQSRGKSASPDYRAFAGTPAIKQTLALDTGRDGQHCARPDCSQFAGDGPDSHAMLCQVSVRQGRWYRLASWTKG